MDRVDFHTDHCVADDDVHSSTARSSRVDDSLGFQTGTAPLGEQLRGINPNASPQRRNARRYRLSLELIGPVSKLP
ncbi:hypothetical protein ACXHXG_24430 [Rhizobium sp. LEGMi198b]